MEIDFKSTEPCVAGQLITPMRNIPEVKELFSFLILVPELDSQCGDTVCSDYVVISFQVEFSEKEFR